MSPKEAKDLHKAKQATDITEIAYLQTTLESLRKMINTENDNFSKRLEEQRNLYTQEKVKLQDEVREIAQEKNRLLAELPNIDALRNEAEEKLKKAEEYLLECKMKNDSLDDLIEMAQSRLDEVNERESKLKEQEVALELRKDGIDKEAKMISDSHIRLNEALENIAIQKQALVTAIHSVGLLKTNKRNK